MRSLVALSICLVLTGCAATPAESASSGPFGTATPGPGGSDAASASPAAAPSPTLPGPPALAAAPLAARVDAADIRPHLVELQAIADAHGGHRVDGSPGLAASVTYVVTRLEAAGYRVATLPFGYRSGAAEHSSFNVVAERPGLAADEVLVLGAHLDSVAVGPGINDNGSGVMTLLAMAEALTEFAPPARTVRFAFWGAEESGQHGSQAYVAGLEATELRRIAAYLNFDMLGSPNHVRFVYADAGAPVGSDAITDLFAGHFATRGLAWEPIDLGGKTDHWPFAAAGIPTGGLFSGGIEPKTDAQAAGHGGTAGVPSDACSHRSCDALANVADQPLDEMADAIAAVLVTLAGNQAAR
jgi:aminopeptidase S